MHLKILIIMYLWLGDEQINWRSQFTTALEHINENTYFKAKKIDKIFI